MMNRYAVNIHALLTLGVAMLLSFEINAHEYWFEPDTFTPALHQITPVHLYVGDGLVKDRQERPFQAAITRMFKLHSVTHSVDLTTSLKEGAMPVYQFSATQSGNYVLAMERDWASISIDAQKFEDYLRADGLDYIVDERAKQGESTKAGREKYSRFIKSLIMVGKTPDDSYQKNLGLTLDITPLENPYNKTVGDTLKFKVMFAGTPLVGKTVFADNRNTASQKMTTDEHGEFTMHIQNSGLWLVRLVYMQRCRSQCEQVDWESYWGAFSFGVN